MPKSKTRLDSSEKRKLLYALHEIESRGLVLPKGAKEVFKKERILWPVADNGYFLKNDGTLYIPTESQEGFINSVARYALFYGSRGSGKTGSGAQKGLKKMELDGGDGAVMNPDFENFKYSTWPELKNWIPWDLVVPSQRYRQDIAWEPHQPFTLVFKDGTTGIRVYCKGLKNPDSARGPNINWLWYDEGGRDLTGLGWKIAVASVRVGRNPQAWVTATPKPTEHWMYKFFIKKEIPPEAIEAFENLEGDDLVLVEAFHGTIEQNKDNLDPGFYASILTAYPSGWLRSQEVDGEFANEGGQIGDRTWFNDRIVEIEPENVIKRVRSWDIAATEKETAKDDPDETVGTLLSSFKPDRNEKFFESYGDRIPETQKETKHFCIEHQVGGFWAWKHLVDAIIATAKMDGPYVEILLEQEPGSGGKNQIAAIKEEIKKIPELSSFKVSEVDSRKVGDRVLAANTHWFGKAAEGLMWIKKGTWTEGFLGQLDGFTQVLHDDKITSVTEGMFVLNPYRSWKKVDFITT